MCNMCSNEELSLPTAFPLNSTRQHVLAGWWKWAIVWASAIVLGETWGKGGAINKKTLDNYIREREREKKRGLRSESSVTL